MGKHLRAFVIMTKGRYGVPITINYIVQVALNLSGYYDLYLMVEPEEVMLYRKILNEFDVELLYTFIVLKKNNAGYSYCRKQLWNRFLVSEYVQVIFSDDDIVNFYEKINDNKNQRTIGLDRILDVVDFMGTSSRALTGLSFRQKHNLCNKDFADFGRISAFIMINTLYISKEDKQNLLDYFDNYDVEKFRLYSDMLMTTGFLAYGYPNNVCYKYAFGTANMAQNEVGGCFIDHKSKNPVESATELNRILGDRFSKVILNKGRVEIRIQWKKLFKDFNKDSRYVIKGVHGESDSEWFEPGGYPTPLEASVAINKLPIIDHGNGMYVVWDNFENEEVVMLPF